MFHYYSTMESCLDRADAGIVGRVWCQFPELRRSEKLKQDLVDAGAVENYNAAVDLPISAATANYCSCIKAAALEEEPRLLGHLYVRYFAG
jgi:heme oxygenase